MSTVMKRLGILTAGALVASTLSLQGQAASGAGEPGAAASAPVPQLVTAAPAGSARMATLEQNQRASRERLVGFNARALSEAKVGARLALGFFDDASYVARVEHASSSSMYQSWSGRLEGVALGTFVAVRSGSVYRAIAMSPEGTYVISSATGRGNLYRAEEIEPQAAQPDDEMSEADVPALERKAERAVAKPTPRQPIAGATERVNSAVAPRATPRTVTDLSARKDSKKQIDIGFTFSPQMVAAVGGIDAANAYAGLAVALNNQAFVNSGIPSSWRLVGTMVGPNEVGDFQSDLVKVSKQKGKYKKVKKFRQKVHADAVSNLIAGNGSLCGIAWIDVNDGKKYWKKPYSVTNYDCVDYMTVSHEVGHNYGASHDPYALKSCPSCGGAAYKYGKALVQLTGRWFTIVAYPDQCLDSGFYCNKVAYFSNPTVAYNGLSTGAKKQYNAKVIKKKSKRMARFNLGQIYPSKVKLKGKAKAGKKLKVKTKKKRWNPKVKLKFQWVVNGAAVPGKKGKRSYLKLKKQWKGMQVYCIVTGKARHYTPVSVNTKVKVI